MDTPSKAAPETGHKHGGSTREQRGLALFRERGNEITETSLGTYRVPGSDGAEYVVVSERGYCSCPDRAETCKHLYCAEVYAAKKRCRRAAPPVRPPRSAPPAATGCHGTTAAMPPGPPPPATGAVPPGSTRLG